MNKQPFIHMANFDGLLFVDLIPVLSPACFDHNLDRHLYASDYSTCLQILRKLIYSLDNKNKTRYEAVKHILQHLDMYYETNIKMKIKPCIWVEYRCQSCRYWDDENPRCLNCKNYAKSSEGYSLFRADGLEIKEYNQEALLALLDDLEKNPPACDLGPTALNDYIMLDCHHPKIIETYVCVETGICRAFVCTQCGTAYLKYSED